MNELELCRSRERKALRRRLVLAGLKPRKLQVEEGTLMRTLKTVRQVTLGDGLRVELPPSKFEVKVPEHLAKPGLLKRAWRGFTAMVRRRP